MSAVKRNHDYLDNEVTEVSELADDDSSPQPKKVMIEPHPISLTTTVPNDFTKIQKYVLEFEKLEKDNEYLRNLAQRRHFELTQLQRSHTEVLKKLEDVKKNIEPLQENVIVETTEYKCLEKKYSMSLNENAHLKELLDGYKRKIDSTTSKAIGAQAQQETYDQTSAKKIIQDLKLQLKRATGEQNEMKLLLDMYKAAYKDERDKTQLVEAEKKLTRELSDLKQQMNTLYGNNMEDQSTNQSQEQKNKVKILENTVFQLQQKLTSQQVQVESLVTEIERTGRAFEDIQEQNVILSQQLNEKNDSYLKLLEENIKQSKNQSITPENTDAFRVQVEWMTNVGLAENGAKLINTSLAENALNQNLNSYTSHDISKPGQNECQGILVKLSRYFLLNRIKFLLRDKDDRSYSYYIETSLNGRSWTRICDYSMHFCRSWQFIVFPETVVRYIKIVGTYCTVKKKLHVVTIQAYLARDKFRLNHTWNAFGLIVPTVNVALEKFGAKVIRGIGANNILNGDLTRHLHNSTYQNAKGQPIVVQLSQPFVIGSMRFLLWDKTDQFYSYDINVSTNLIDWETVAHSENERSWQIVKFKPVPVVFIWIVSTSKNDVNKDFRLVHFECPLQPPIRAC